MSAASEGLEDRKKYHTSSIYNPNETLEKQGRAFFGKISLSKLAEKFAGNFSKIRQAKIKNSPHSAEPWDQQWEAYCDANERCTAIQMIRKILVSVKCLSAILGPEMAAPILWALGKDASVLQEKPCP